MSVVTGNLRFMSSKSKTDPENIAVVDQGAIERYTSPSGAVSLQVLNVADSVWLNRQQIAALFGRDVKTIGKHSASARGEELHDM